MSQEEKQYFVPIPASTDPNSIGGLVREALQRNYSVTISEGTARSISMMAAESIEKNKENIEGVEFRVGTDGFGWIFKSSNEGYKKKFKKVKRIIATEGLILIGILIAALIISQIKELQDWIINLGLCYRVDDQILRDKLGISTLGEIVIKRSSTTLFLSFLALYGLFRFILWSVKTLKK